MKKNSIHLMAAGMWLSLSLNVATAAEPLAAGFASPPASARPWVYWYFMDGNMSRSGMTADLEAMKQAGIGGAIFLEVNIGIPRGPVDMMSPEWLKLVGYAAKEADRLGIQLALGTGPGWCGTGGPWVTPELSMQHLVGSETKVTGPLDWSGVLPRPLPREPYFGEGTLTPELKKVWQEYYVDEAVLAFPTPPGQSRLADADAKAIYYRDPFSSKVGVAPFLPAPAEFPDLPAGQCLDASRLINLTSHLAPDGRLTWTVPPGNWTILRLGRTTTGQTTRPAPRPGLGLESDKFAAAALDAHFAAFTQKILDQAGPHTNHYGGITMLHFDSWEMGAQNWSPAFRAEFRQRRGYDPLPYLPALLGRVVNRPEISERFLWDLRHTASELVVENHLGHLATLAHQHGLTLSCEPYDLNPAGDLTLGRVADVPQCEFWHLGFDSTYSVFEAASIAHTCGRPIVAAEAFTSEPGENWQADPASLKAQGDWAFCTGVNRLDFHRMQHQPTTNQWPGMTMGPYGVHWDRTQTWWDMVPAYHEYLARCQYMLQRGVTVADVCFLAAEGAPHVFRPPLSAATGTYPDHTGYNFDGCAPETLRERATVKAGKLVFPGGTTYQILVLPEVTTMTPDLLEKIASLVHAGATVFGPPPVKSPSLQNYPQCDARVQKLAAELWGDCNGQTVFAHPYGHGRVLWRSTSHPPMNQYGEYGAITNVLGSDGLPPDFSSDGPIRFTHRNDHDTEIYFVANSQEHWVDAQCQFRVTGRQPELWNPQTGESRPLPQYTTQAGITTIPLRFEPLESWFVIFRQPAQPPQTGAKNMASLQPLGSTPTSRPSLQIIKATYAAVDGAGQLDATAPVTAAVHDGRLSLGVANETFGADPANNRLKQLRVEYVTAGTANTTVVPEHGWLSLSAGWPVAGPWEVDFDAKWGGPHKVTFESLADWSQRAEPGIKYYSGTATYRKSLMLPTGRPMQGQKYYLDLGVVKNLAHVRLNGRDLGVLWCAPWRVEISAALQPGANDLQIEVANLWPNRLIGDQALPENQRFTTTTLNPYHADSPLLPSGLLGPVTILTSRP